MPAPSRLSDALRIVPGRTFCSSGPSARLKAICCSSVMSWSWNTSTAWRSMPAWIAAASSGVIGRRRSRPETSPPMTG